MLGLAFAAPVTASADSIEVKARPTGCKYQIADAWRTVAYCANSNGGSYRALARCKDAESGEVREYVGDWRKSGWSKAYCQGSARPKSAGIETKV
ncbi:hypothetical protein GCM10010277_66280 [Streptomyces longisporoflavus]|nr:hypothetical protein GCM10010277_66280 [Streptomyces longisporoflavus]